MGAAPSAPSGVTVGRGALDQAVQELRPPAEQHLTQPGMAAVGTVLRKIKDVFNR